MTYWRQEKVESALNYIEDFTPSTTREEGNILTTSFDEWNENIRVKQQSDWDKICKILKKYKLGKKELGFIWFICDSKYNWRGWTTIYGLLFKMELSNK